MVCRASRLPSKSAGMKVLLVKNNRKNPQTASNNTPSTGKIKDVDF